MAMIRPTVLCCLLAIATASRVKLKDTLDLDKEVLEPKLTEKDFDEGILSMVRGAASAFAEMHRSAMQEVPQQRVLTLYNQLQRISTEGAKQDFVRALSREEQAALKAYGQQLLDESAKTINGGRALPTATPGDNSRPEVAFDEGWFNEHCKNQEDPTRFTKYYKDQVWQDYKKCEDSEGVAQEFSLDSKELCEVECKNVAATDPTSTYCCEFDSTENKCSVTKGFSNMRESSKNYFKNNFGDHGKKVAKYIKAQKTVAVGDGINEEFGGIQESSDFMKRLVEQVNHMSIDGILRHLLSFYTCIRWVPDEQFIDLAKYEFTNVDVDAQTRRKENATVTDDDAINAYINFDAVPLKCSSGMDVQDLGMIDTLLEELKDKKSAAVEAYEFSKSVAEQAKNFVGAQKWWGAAADTKARLSNKAEIGEMTDKARTIFPWDGFIRPSQQYTWGMNFKWGTHVSKPKNLFFICFGPRVSSFPHKREGGGHFLADMNMAGCNGLWSLDDAINHIDRIRQLFAPETCLTDDLRRKLKQTFLETFVEMNQGFEQKITGNMFSGGYQGVNTIPEELRDSTPAYLASMDPNQPDFMRSVETDMKFQRMGRLVSGAHTKWVVCGAKRPDDPATGLASSFFNSPSAYRKWFDGAIGNEKMMPECKTFDPVSGCMKCVIAVRSHPYRCLLRLGLTFDQIMDAVRGQVAPMASSYDTVRIMDVQDDKGQVVGHKKVLKKEHGVCMVQKDARDKKRITDREKFRSVGATDRIVRVTRSKVGEMGFSVQDRYGIQDRREAYAQFIEEGGVEKPELSEEDRLADAINRAMTEGEQTHAPEERFGPRMTFSEIIPEENNVIPHEVDYFMTCPCREDDFSQLTHHKELGVSGMADYMLG